MITKSFVLISIFCINEKSHAIDPFQSGLFTLECFKERPGVHCEKKGTLSDAYKNSTSQSDIKHSYETNTRAFLFNKNNKNPEFLHSCSGMLPNNTLYNPNKGTVIIICGFLATACSQAWAREIKDQLLCHRDLNVIIVDHPGTIRLDYYSALNSVPTVAKELALLINNIMTRTSQTGDAFHLIGHSLGSHIAGLTGQHVKSKLRRITALDFAGPGLMNTSANERLDPTDAKLVDCIHSNGGDCLPYAFGDLRPFCHYDIYPNGGSVQISCLPNMLISYLKGDLEYATISLIPSACFHLHSIQYFKASINACNCQFIAVECSCYEDFKLGKCPSCGADGSKCLVMGMDLERFPRGPEMRQYYLKTGENCPYCISDNGNIDTSGYLNKSALYNGTVYCCDKY